MVALNGTVGLVGASGHEHAMRRLKHEMPRVDWRELDRDGDADFPIVLLREDNKLPEGAFDMYVSADGRRIEITGGPFSGVIGGVETLIRSLAAGNLSAGYTEDRPAITYRTFWTWDHSSNWDLRQIGAQETGVFNPYGKPPAGFARDYKAMVDFCSRERIGAIVIYGFLRDSHGGVEAAQDLCRYANERGVRIVPGIAIGAYGGVYWEGDHRANLSTWLHRHPEYAASLHGGVGFSIEDLEFPLTFPRSDYTQAACPSQPATQKWMVDSVTWLAETFEIGGVNVESGDYGICGCERCVGRRGSNVRQGDSWSHDDMMENFPPLEKALSGVRDGLWITCELQWDNVLDASQHPARALPPNPIYQHTANGRYLKRLDESLTRDHVAALPYEKSALRLHVGSQWNGDEQTERYALVAREFEMAAKVSARSGMQGLTVWGEASPYHGANEVNYLAFAYFSLQPEATWGDFMQDRIVPILGDRAAAETYVDVLASLTSGEVEMRPLLDRVRAEAASARGEAADRWWRLSDRIDRIVYSRG